MNHRPYVALWLMLTGVLVALMALALMEREITIGPWTLKKAPFRSALLGEKNEQYDYVEDLEHEVVEAVTSQVDTTPQVFLIIGDSMTSRLANRLAAYVEQNGHRSVHAVNWDSSTSVGWAESDKIETYMAKYNPTFIFVCLGSNESYMANPEVRRPQVERIVAKFGDVPFVWIGPPDLGRKVTYNEMIRSVVGPNRFFLSYGLELERGSDHIHPNQKASNEWMDSVMRWIPKSIHPFKAEKPAEGVKGHLDYVWFGPDRPAADSTAVEADSIAVPADTVGSGTPAPEPETDDAETPEPEPEVAPVETEEQD